MKVNPIKSPIKLKAFKKELKKISKYQTDRYKIMNQKIISNKKKKTKIMNIKKIS